MLRVALLLSALVVSGCFNPEFQPGILCGERGACPGDLVCNLANQTCEEEGSSADGSIGVDSTVPTVDAAAADAVGCSAFQSQHLNACALPMPGAMVLGGGVWTYDTDTGALADPQGGESFPPSVVTGGGARILSVDYYQDTNTTFLRVVGSRPLIIASWSTIQVDGLIIVRSNSTGDGLPGAGANPSSCIVAAAGGAGTSGGAGGGGGSFQSAGGMGGDGATGEPGTTTGGVAGTAVSVPTTVRGGCAGGNGGSGDQPQAGSGGAGGGALQLTAFAEIVIAGGLLAGGQGASPSNEESGGGGGGSGGFLGLEAPDVSIELTAVITSNGGAGSGGAYNNNGPSQQGEDGRPNETAAEGGVGTNTPQAGAGGNGSAVSIAAVDGVGGTKGAGATDHPLIN